VAWRWGGGEVSRAPNAINRKRGCVVGYTKREVLGQPASQPAKGRKEGVCVCTVVNLEEARQLQLHHHTPGRGAGVSIERTKRGMGRTPHCVIVWAVPHRVPTPGGGEGANKKKHTECLTLAPCWRVTGPRKTDNTILCWRDRIGQRGPGRE
jgi:hypothetical protein